MSAWAKPGVKCVCISTDPSNAKLPFGYRWDGDIRLELGAEYTISSVRPHPLSGEVCVKLVELDGRGPDDFGYNVLRFRPLITKTQEQDVALFRHILDGLPVGEPV